MDRPVSVHPGDLIWSGEHWILGICPDDSEEPSGWVSLFHTRYSPAGEGTTAQVMIPGEPGVSVIAADCPEVARFTTEQFLSRGSFFDADAPLVNARFERRGDLRSDPGWRIETDAFTLIARWQLTEPPVIADGTFRAGTEHYTILFFTDAASVELDGRRIEGQPYPRDIWEPTIGGQRSSCVIALAETLVELPPGSTS